MTFYLDHQRLFYESRTGIFLKNVEPIEMFFHDMYDPSIDNRE